MSAWVISRRGVFIGVLAAGLGACGVARVNNTDDALTDGGASDGGPSDGGARDSGMSPDGGDQLDAGLADGGVTADAGRGNDAGPPVDASITVDRTTTLARIGGGMAGLSYEKDHLNNGFFTPTNTDLIGLFKRLGPSVLRLGGNSVDKTTWSATGTGNTAGVIGPPDVTALAGFLQATGWTVIYGVNMAADDPSAATAEATYVSTALGSSLDGFEIGNECDEYPTNGDRPTTWTYADFFAQWQTFYTPMLAGAPGAAFTGPASASHYSTWTVPFAQSAASDIDLLTQHYYRGNGMSASSTLTELLMPDPALIPELQALEKAATTNHLARGYRLGEANSFYNGGADGISDGFGASLWVVDFLFTNAQYGSAGVNFHGGGDSTGYTPIADLNSVVVEARPDYYGMFMFTLAGQGDMLATKVTIANLNFTAYTVAPSDGTTNVVLLNKDPSSTVHATVDINKAGTTGATTLLTAPSLGSTSGFTIGGVPVNKDGTWTPAASPPVAVTGTTFVIDVPPASGLLVQVR